MHCRFIDSINEVSATTWNALTGSDYPFIQHAFLAALESSDCLGKQRGWIPHHLLIEDNDRLVGFMPLYLKLHSYGEYVFDWSWADAYQRYGQAYYPKLLSAVPFTPCAGPRICLHQSLDGRQALATIIESIEAHCRQQGYSSWHVLFPDKAQRQLIKNSHLEERLGVQFHWSNKHYQRFDDFLAEFSSRKRKNVKKERRRVLDNGIRLQCVEGVDISDEQWQHFYHFYQLTYAKRSGHGGYLTQAFFQCLGQHMPNALMMVIATKGDRVIAAALNMKDSTTLYGRYWGCYDEFEFLHFEACYYQGIEYCIKNGFERFDAGAQGEHKIQRGFRPVLTYSYHHLADGSFRLAISDYLHEDAKAVKQYYEDATVMLPFSK